MNSKIKQITTVACSLACAFSVCACGNTSSIVAKSRTLAEPPVAAALGVTASLDEEFCAFKDKVGEFSAKFAAAANTNKGNFAVSPASVFMGLALAAECTAGNTRTELLNALGVDYNTLLRNIHLLFRSLNVDFTEITYNDGEKKVEEITGGIKLTNSIWVNDGTSVKSNCLNELANTFYCYSHAADFKNNNLAANRAVRNFAKEKSNGLIDQDFELDEDTLFALINTLYLKDIWNKYGNDLSLSNDVYEFIGQNTTKRTKLLNGGYKFGKTYKTDDFSAFYSSTYNGLRLYFFTPNDGKTIDQVFTAQNINDVRTHNYQENAVDHENRINYFTMCQFPEYKASYDEDIAETLHDEFGINDFFDKYNCDGSSLTDDPVYCGKINHVTKLEVNKKGIEGAAVTIVDMMAGSAAPIEPEIKYENVYELFTVDKSFGFIITDLYRTTLFSGIVYDI